MASTPMLKRTKRELHDVVNKLLANHLEAHDRSFALSVPRLYTQAIPPEAHAAIKTMQRFNKAFMNHSSRLELKFEGIVGGTERFTGTVALQLPNSKPTPNTALHDKSRLYLPPAAGLYGELQEWVIRRVVLCQANKSVRAWVKPLINQSSTVSQLVYLWPEFTEFMSPGVRARLGTTRGRGPSDKITTAQIRDFQRQQTGINDWLMQAFLLGNHAQVRDAVLNFSYSMSKKV